jgi:hypothetical protein
MRKYTIDEIKGEFDKRGYKWYPLHFVGVRSNADKPNEFDDLFGIIHNNTLRWFSCTTNPGTHWLKNLLNPKGTALLKPNQYVDTWALGKHQGKYEALVQVLPVDVFRDKNLNLKSEETAVIDRGLFGINIHRANENFASKFIDKWSAGCQVLNNPADFKALMDLVKASGQKRFTYTLLKEI